MTKRTNQKGLITERKQLSLRMFKSPITDILTRVYDMGLNSEGKFVVRQNTLEWAFEELEKLITQEINKARLAELPSSLKAPPITQGEQLKPVIGKTLNGQSLNPTIQGGA